VQAQFQAKQDLWTFTHNAGNSAVHKIMASLSADNWIEE
jgi:hypothetical protein